MTNLDISSKVPGFLGAAISAEARSGQYVAPAKVQKLLKIFDAICAFVTFTGLFFYSLRFLSDDAAIIAGTVIAAEATYVCILGMRWIRIYDVDILARPLRGTAAALSLITLVGVVVLWLIDFALFELQGKGMVAWILVNAAHILTSRTVVGLWAKPLAKAGCFERRIAIVGGGEFAGEAIRALEASTDIDIHILGMYDDRTDDRSPPVVAGYRKLGNLAKLAEAARRGEVDMVVLAIPMTAHIRLMQLLPKLWLLPVEVRVCGQAIDMKLSPSAYGYLGRLPLLTVFSRPRTSGMGFAKQATDFLVAAVLVAALSPLLALIAAAIATTSAGPILIRQARKNFDNGDLELSRFRTRSIETGEFTAVGKVLRALHLDKLARLFDVLQGKLAIVGPAPHVRISEGEVGHYERVANAYCLRHHVKPGLTGWAQIHGLQNDSDSPEGAENRVKYDLEYVDRASWLFDLSILLKTPFAWIRNERPEYTV